MIFSFSNCCLNAERQLVFSPLEVISTQYTGLIVCLYSPDTDIYSIYTHMRCGSDNVHVGMCMLIVFLSTNISFLEFNNKIKPRIQTRAMEEN